jgi:hypothetical protein
MQHLQQGYNKARRCSLTWNCQVNTNRKQEEEKEQTCGVITYTEKFANPWEAAKNTWRAVQEKCEGVRGQNEEEEKDEEDKEKRKNNLSTKRRDRYC